MYSFLHVPTVSEETKKKTKKNLTEHNKKQKLTKGGFKLSADSFLNLLKYKLNVTRVFQWFCNSYRATVKPRGGF